MISRLAFVLMCGASFWFTVATLRKRFPALRQASRKIDLPLDGIRRRLWRVFSEVLLQTKVVGTRPLVGFLHALVMWGFIAFATMTLHHLWLGVAGFQNAAATVGGWYGRFVAIWAVAVLAGISGLTFRRFVLRPQALGKLSWTSAIVSALIMVLMVTYLVAWAEILPPASNGWVAVWWLHTLALLVFPPIIVRSKHLHLALAPVAIFFRSETTSRMRALDLEHEDLGLINFSDLPVNDILNVNACVECGRCTDVCPAHRSGGSLDPKEVVLQIQRGFSAGGTIIAGGAEEVAGGTAWVAEDDLMQCYACGACEQACPVGVEHVGRKILDLRRGLVSDDRIANARAAKSFSVMGKAPHNPWGLSQDFRRTFITDQRFPRFTKGTEWLFWLGCGNSYDPHGQTVARAMRKILDASGASWGVLEEETCCGEPARRIGNEALFLELSQKLIDSFRRQGVRNIVTCCPHCTTMLDGDYRQLDEYAELAVQVVHHTEFISKILGRLPLIRTAATVAYHDPCNLSRGRGITSEPRAILQACGALLREPRDHGRATLCCGAGGGQLFISDDSHPDASVQRVNVQRFDQLMETAPDLVAVACPYCPIMLRDAAQAAAAGVSILDVAEIVAQHLGPTQQAEEGP